MKIFDYIKDHSGWVVGVLALCISTGGYIYQFKDMQETVAKTTEKVVMLQGEMQKQDNQLISLEVTVKRVESTMMDLLKEQQNIQKETNEILHQIKTELAVQGTKITNITEDLKDLKK